MRIVPGLFLLASSSACVGTTGGDTFTFEAYARGPESANGQSYSFTNGAGYAVTLTRARVHVGGVYLNQSRPTQVASNPSCTLSGIYVAEIAAELEVDALSRELQAFPALGSAISERAPTGEVWLNGGDVSAISDPTVVLDLAGDAAKDGQSFPFRASLTISSNRKRPTPPEKPGAEPICKQRIVSPIPLDVTPLRGGRMILEIDPARMFTNVEFGDLLPGRNGIFEFQDDDTPGPNRSLYEGLRSSRTYTIHWETE